MERRERCPDLWRRAPGLALERSKSFVRSFVQCRYVTLRYLAAGVRLASGDSDWGGCVRSLNEGSLEGRGMERRVDPASRLGPTWGSLPACLSARWGSWAPPRRLPPCLACRPPGAHAGKKNPPRCSPANVAAQTARRRARGTPWSPGDLQLLTCSPAPGSRRCTPRRSARQPRRACTWTHGARCSGPDACES